MSIRVLLADDQALVRVGFRMILEETDNVEVVGEAVDGAEAVRLTHELAPDVVLMDVRMPGMDGIAATQAIIADHPTARILVLTTFDLDEYAFAALRAGASGFVPKSVPVSELAAAIQAVADGDAVVSPRITRQLLDAHAHQLPGSAAPEEQPGRMPSAATAKLDRLTTREAEVLLAVANGLSNREIADALVVSEATVKTHVGSILAKLELRNRVHAVIYAYDAGLVRVE